MNGLCNQKIYKTNLEKCRTNIESEEDLSGWVESQYK